jgi:hypothetical protein
VVSTIELDMRWHASDRRHATHEETSVHNRLSELGDGDGGGVVISVGGPGAGHGEHGE